MTTPKDNFVQRSRHRVSFDCEEDLMDDVRAYRHAARHETLSDAYKALWRAGLEALKREGRTHTQSENGGTN